MKKLLILSILSFLFVSLISSNAHATACWAGTDAAAQTTEIRICTDISAAGIPSYFSLIPSDSDGIFYNSGGNFVTDTGFVYDDVANDLSVLNNMEAANFCDEAGASCVDTAVILLDADIGGSVQAFDAVLDDLSALSVIADNEIIVGTGAGTYANESGATARTSLGLAIGTDVQAFDAVLDDLSALSVIADNEFIVGTGAGTYANESGATARTSLGVAIGVDVQAFDANNALTDVAQEYTAQQNFNATTLTSLGADLVTNGTFASDTNWTKGTGWTIAAGVADSDATQSADSDLTEQTLVLVSGNTYEVTFTVTNYVAGNVTPVAGGTEGTDRAANGTFIENILSAGADLDIRADLDFDGNIDNVIVKLVNVSWNLNTNQVTSLTLDGDLVLDNPTNQVDGSTYIIRLIQDGTGSQLLTYGSVYKFPGGTTPTLTTAASSKDILTCVSNGTNMDCVFQADFK